MRTLQRNRQTLWYALYVSKTEATDSENNYTGETVVSYSTPVKAKMNISGGRGQADVEAFGIDNPFTHTLVTGDLTTAFSTDSVFWIGIDPGIINNVPTVPHNFRCTGVAKTINSCTLAVAEVDKT